MAVFKPTGTLHRVTDITPSCSARCTSAPSCSMWTTRWRRTATRRLHRRARVDEADDRGRRAPCRRLEQLQKARGAVCGAVFAAVCLVCLQALAVRLPAREAPLRRARANASSLATRFSRIFSARTCAACPRCFWIPSRATRPRRCASSAGSSISSGRIISGWIQNPQP